MKSRSQQPDTNRLPWGLPSVIAVWLIWLMMAYAGRILLEIYAPLSLLRSISASGFQNLNSSNFAPGSLVAIALLVPALVAALIAFRTVAARYRGAPLEALAFDRQNPVWVLAVVVLFGVLLAFLLRFALGWSKYPLPLLEAPAAFPSALDFLLYAVGVPVTALLAGGLVFGFCYPILVARFGKWAGGLASALFFALPQVAAQGVYWQPAAALLAMGVYLTAVRQRTDSAYTATLGYTGFSVYIALSVVLANLAVA